MVVLWLFVIFGLISAHRDAHKFIEDKFSAIVHSPWGILFLYSFLFIFYN